MPDAYSQGVVTPYGAVNAGAVIEEAFGVAVNYFINRTPLTTRLPKPPLGSLAFKLVNDSYRPRVGVIANSGTAVGSGTTTLPVGDASVYDVGDVLEVNVAGVYEAMLVTAITPGAPSTLTVTRGYAGTTAAAIPDASSVYLLTNTRTGGEININAIDRTPQIAEQYSQTVQHAYQIGGALESATSYVSAYGTPVQRDKFFCMQHVMDDFEEALYYGRGVQLATGVSRPGMKGFRSLIQTNNAVNPTNYAAYKPSDLIRDAIQPCYDGGGQPALLLVSTSFMTGLSVWGERQMWLDAGATKFGVKINMFSVSFLPDIVIVTSPLLKKGDLFAFSAGEVRVRIKRELFDKPRGSRGDAIEGDMIMEGAGELDNEAHHAYVSGISGWAPEFT